MIQHIIILTKMIHFQYLYNELMIGSFIGKIDDSRKITYNSEMGTDGKVFINLTEALIQDEINEIDAIVLAHNSMYSQSHLAQISSYSKYRLAGQFFYDEMRTQYIIDVTTGAMTMEDAYHLDGITRNITKEIESGSWHTGWRYVQLLVVDAIFTQEIKDKLILDIKTYINANYPIELHVV